MKKSYLLGVLLSGALLAACTADDDLNTGNLAQQANPSAPVFNVKFDGEQGLTNRAYYESDKVTFQPTDLMSLYHGAKDFDMKNWQNAVYKGEMEGDQFLFSTQAIVNPGKAIMVYPADTEFYNDVDGTDNVGLASPIVHIDVDQTTETKLNTPYMSEVIDISAITASNKPAYAGYGEQYDIILRRIASTLYLKLDKKGTLTLPAGVEPLKVEKVALNDKTESVKPFTTDIAVIGKNEPSVARNDNAGVHKSWYKSEVDYEATSVPANSTTNQLTTTDLSATNDTAFFTLLPKYKNNTAEFANGQVVVTTNYGTVTMSEEVEDNSQHKYWKKGSTAMTITDGLKALNKNEEVLWDKATKGNFYNEVSKQGENVGGYLNRTVEWNVEELDMDGLHIKNEAHLIDVLKVYTALKPEGKVTFYLDGTKGKFVLNEAGRKALVAQLEANGEDDYVEFVPCGEKGELCTAIQLVNGTTAVEVPDLVFGQGTNNTGANPADIELIVELEGSWKYEAVAKDPTVTSNYQAPKTLDGITTLQVNSGASLTLKNFVSVDEDAEDGFAIQNNGTVTVSGIVYLDVDLNNSGTVNISGTTDDLRVRSEATLTNNAAAGNKATGWSEGAIINVNGALGVVTNSQGSVENYGIIYQKRALANVYVSKNADNALTAGIQAAFGNGEVKSGSNVIPTNRFGTIYLADASADAGNHVTVKANEGFIKIEIDEETPKKASCGDKANYVVLKGKSKNIIFGTVGSGNNAVDYLPTTAKNLRFVEVDSSVEEVTMTAAPSLNLELKGLFVRAGNKVIIPDNSKITTVNAYIEGDASSVHHAGTFTYTTLTGYFGGSANDTNKVINDGK